jgi:hypothetical protein
MVVCDHTKDWVAPQLACEIVEYMLWGLYWAMILVLNCILFAGGHFPHCLILYSMFLFLLPRHWWCYRWSLDHVLCYLSWKMVPLESGVICRDSLLPFYIRKSWIVEPKVILCKFRFDYLAPFCYFYPAPVWHCFRVKQNLIFFFLFKIIFLCFVVLY